MKSIPSVFMYAMNIQNEVIGLVLSENCKSKQVIDFIAWPRRCHGRISMLFLCQTWITIIMFWNSLFYLKRISWNVFTSVITNIWQKVNDMTFACYSTFFWCFGDISSKDIFQYFQVFMLFLCQTGIILIISYLM